MNIVEYGEMEYGFQMKILRIIIALISKKLILFKKIKIFKYFLVIKNNF
ncbi:MAG: hypothetical protein LBQ13_01320 [Endomicrobium sp.]|jgi:hypothetical protein|nr:hypothetical protein [Endomicrobium sp.]